MTARLSAPFGIVVVVLFVVVIFCSGDRNDPTLAYNDMYVDGRVAYTSERWFEAIDFLERSIEDWHWYRMELAQCRIKCKRFSEDLGIDSKMLHFDLILAGRWILNAACQKKCKREKFGGRKAKYDELVENDFLDLKPYNYLQLAYYKASQHVTNYQEMIYVKTHQADFLEKAIQCAYTYLLRHPEDKTMRQNLEFYKSIPATKDWMYKTREEAPHQKYYKAASAAYDQETPDFKATKENIEFAIREYYKAYAVCEAHCEKPLTNSTEPHSNSSLTEDLFINIADHMSSYVDCALKCPDNLAMFLGSVLENYLPNHYHYLQFAAYKVDDTENVAMGCATYLLFHPDDKDMKNNKRFFMEKMNVPAELFAADQAAVDHLNHLREIKSLKNLIDSNYKVAKGATKKSVPAATSAATESKPSITPDQLSPITDAELRALKKEFGVVLYADAEKLNGTHRFALDNLAATAECDRLVQLASAGSGGDGYGRFKGTGSHPHTPHESFEGLTINRAAELAEEGTIKWEDAWLFLDLAERSRAVTEKYFKLPSKLFFSFSHLVCRTAESSKDQKTREDLSHPVHSDNCNLLEDGTCIYTYPAYTWRDFSSITYLNDDFDGGNFLFANPDKSIRAELRPVPGRIVAFHNGIDNLHGVKAVTSGRRCALAMWYTMDPSEHEKGQENHESARNILTRLKLEAEEGSDAKETVAAESSPSTAPVVDDSGEVIDDATKVTASDEVEIKDLDGGYIDVGFEGPTKHNEL